MRSFVLLVLTAALTLAVQGTAAATCAGADLQPTAANLDRLAAATFCLHNAQRARAGRPPLAWNERLATSARLHSEDMVRQLFFDHTNLAGLAPDERILAAGYGADWSGENIATGMGGTEATPRTIMAGWMASDGHRANVLRSSFEHVGIGVAYGFPFSVGLSPRAATYTANFGSTSERVAPLAGEERPPADAPTAEDPATGAPEDGEPDLGDPEPGGAETGNPEPGGAEAGGSEGEPETGGSETGGPRRDPTPAPTKPSAGGKKRKALKRCLKRAGKSRKKRKRCKRRFS